MKKEKFKILIVTTEEKFLIPMIDKERTDINGWKMEDVVKDWFGKRIINSPHASRHAHSIGGSKKLISTRIEKYDKSKIIIL